MEKLIALYGSANTGKTTALLDFIEKIPKLDIQIIKNADEKTLDKLFVFKMNNKIIGISTGGDSQKIIESKVEEVLIQKYNCDIVFTAARTKGGTVVALENLKKKYSCKLIWIEKLYRSHDPVRKNNLDPKNIFFNQITSIESDYLLSYLTLSL